MITKLVLSTPKQQYMKIKIEELNIIHLKRNANPSPKVDRNKIEVGGRKSQKANIFWKIYKNHESSFKEMVNRLSCYHIGSQLNKLVILNQKITKLKTNTGRTHNFNQFYANRVEAKNYLLFAEITIRSHWPSFARKLYLIKIEVGPEIIQVCNSHKWNMKNVKSISRKYTARRYNPNICWTGIIHKWKKTVFAHAVVILKSKLFQISRKKLISKRVNT